MNNIKSIYSSNNSYLPAYKQKVRSYHPIALATTTNVGTDTLALYNKAFINFTGGAKENPNDVEELLLNIKSYMTPENYIGSGHDAYVYSLNDKYVLRCDVCRNNCITEDSVKFDYFEGRNFGQPVAIKDHYQICKRVSGKPIFKSDMTPAETLETLQMISEMPDSTLDSFVDDFVFIHSKGWSVDNTRGNFLYDKDTQKIGFIDLAHYVADELEETNNIPTYSYILDGLLDINYYCVYNQMTPDERQTMLKLVKNIGDRLHLICDKHGVPDIESGYSSYKLRINGVKNLVDMADEIDCTKGLYTQIAKKRYPDILEECMWIDIHMSITSFESNLAENKIPYAKVISESQGTQRTYTYIVLPSETEGLYDLYSYGEDGIFIGVSREKALSEVREDYKPDFDPSEIKIHEQMPE